MGGWAGVVGVAVRGVPMKIEHGKMDAFPDPYDGWRTFRPVACEEVWLRILEAAMTGCNNHSVEAAAKEADKGLELFKERFK